MRLIDADATAGRMQDEIMEECGIFCTLALDKEADR